MCEFCGKCECECGGKTLRLRLNEGAISGLLKFGLEEKFLMDFNIETLNSEMIAIRHNDIEIGDCYCIIINGKKGINLPIGSLDIIKD